MQEELRGSAGQGRRQGARRADARGQAHVAQPWFLQQLSHHSFLAVNRQGRREVRDKWTEARTSSRTGRSSSRGGSTTPDRPRQVGRMAERRRGRLKRVNGRMISDGTTAVQAFENNEVDVTGTIPPDEIPRLRDTPSTRSTAGPRHVLLRVQHQEHPGCAPAPGHGARDRSPDDHRQHRAGRPGACDRLHAGGNAWIRRDQPAVAVAARVGRSRPGQGADGAGTESEEADHALVQRGYLHTRRSPWPSRPVEGAGHRRHAEGTGVRAVPRIPRAHRRTTRSTSSGSDGSATTSTR